MSRHEGFRPSERNLGAPPRVPAAVVGGVLNYCDPERYREIVFPINRAWKVAVGIHPKHAPRVDDRMLDQLEALVCDTRVAGISELGLDHSTPPATWGLQEKLLDRILRMGVSGRVLVIHARENDRSGDPYGEAIHCRIRELLLRRCTRHQRVQVHCASTSVAQVRAWGKGVSAHPFQFWPESGFFHGPTAGGTPGGPARPPPAGDGLPVFQRTGTNPPDPSLPWGSSGTCGPYPP